MIWNLSVRIKSFFNPQALRQEEIEKLHAIAKHWHHLGQCKFASATNYPEGSIERRFVEHGAWCYTNCALKLSRETIIMAEFEEFQECSGEANLSHTQK